MIKRGANASVRCDGQIVLTFASLMQGQDEIIYWLALGADLSAQGYFSTYDYPK